MLLAIPHTFIPHLSVSHMYIVLNMCALKPVNDFLLPSHGWHGKYFQTCSLCQALILLCKECHNVSFFCHILFITEVQMVSKFSYF
jgi:hypothetical protein